MDRPAFWTREKCILAARQWARDHHRTPMRKDWAGSGLTKHPEVLTAEQLRGAHPGTHTIEKLFGNWRKFIQSVGLEPYDSRRESRVWTREKIIRAGENWIRVMGRAPSGADWQHRRQHGEPPRPSTKVVLKMFGNFGRYHRVLGVKALPGRRQWSREQIALAGLHWLRKQGRLPVSRDWRPATSDHPGYTTVLRHFSGWDDFIAAIYAKRRLLVERGLWADRLRERQPDDRLSA